ncbi:B3 domain-containing transcription factor FUS3-like [Vitis riparia]|uniref:B3 domain-containing transcription factor FUS3-like n=1 Tax=Vitis riparia TaxID=96939 RepID=UPI00155B1FA6|nr:B3 domain-containing transcription factor FUS3-like [Vitis riparia]
MEGGGRGRGEAVPIEEETVGASSPTASRVNRRRSGRGSSRRTASLNSLVYRGSSTSSSRPRPTPEQRRPVSPEVEVDSLRYSFLFQKELKYSDVSSTKRIVIPKALAETYLPTLYTIEGTLISMEDMDGLGTWTFRFRYWINNLTRMYVLENTGEFIRAHGLCANDFIILYKDNRNDKYVIKGSKSIYNACPQHMIEEGLDSQIGEDERNESKTSMTTNEIGIFSFHSSILLDDAPKFSSASLLDFPRRMPSFESLDLSLEDFK